MLRRLAFVLVASLLVVEAANAQPVMDGKEYAFGAVPDSCTLVSAIPNTVREIYIYNSLDRDVIIATDDSCADEFQVMAGKSTVLDVDPKKSSSGWSLYIIDDGTTPGSGNIYFGWVK